jgi:CBS domain-containing protein
MKVQDVMTCDVHTCSPDTSLSMAATQMWNGDFGVLPVLGDGGKVVGMITDRDICMAVAIPRRDSATIRVGDIVTGQVHWCSPESDIHWALSIMQQRGVRRLPVIEDGKLVGILSMNDIAIHAGGSRKAELSDHDVEETLRTICNHSTFAPKPLAEIKVLGYVLPGLP